MMRPMKDNGSSAPPSATDKNPKSDPFASLKGRSINGPAMGFVRGGTGTAASETLFAKRFREAEERRLTADREKAASSGQKEVRMEGQKGVAKVPEADGKAVMYTSQMTDHPEVPKAYIKLTYLTSAGDPYMINGDPVECLADLIVGMDQAFPTELSLVIVCPRCTQNSHKHQQDNQLRIRQRNKSFTFVPATGDPYVTFDDDPAETRARAAAGNVVAMNADDGPSVYASAGTIVESERFSCGDCGWAARIVNNTVRPD